MSLPQIISASAASQAPLQISGGVFTHAEGNISQHVHLAPEKEFDAGEFLSPADVTPIAHAFRSGFQLLQRYINGDALYNSEQRFPPPKCHPQTRIAVQEALQSWAVSQDGPNVLWLHGPAGAGKSAIAQTMAETWSTSAHLAAAFFFARWRTGGAIGAKLFPTLAYQFALRFPGLRRPVGSAMEEDPGICDKTFEEQARVLIRDPFLDSELTWDYASPHLVVIDGLDECDSKVAQTRIIKIISELLLARDVPHRFLICSRPEPHIRAAFDSLWASGLVYQQLMLDDEFKPSHDIRLYLTESFEQLRDRLPMTTSPHWPSKEDLDLLVRKASGQFIYAATVLKFVDDEYSDPQERLRLILDADPSFDEESASAFADLDRLYYVILSANPNTMLVKQILGAYFALPGFGELKIEVRVISFLDGILGLPVGTTRRALRGIHSLFSIPSRDIRDNQGDDVQITPYHASLQDFLYSRPRSREFFLDAEHHHENLMARCLEITLLPLDDLNRHWSWQRNLILYSQNCWSDHFVDTPAQVTLIASSLERLQGLLAPQEFLRHSPGAMLRRIGGIVDFVSGLLVRARHGPQRPLPPNIIDACNSLANTLFLTMFQPSPESRQFYDTREIQVRHSSKHLTASPRCRKVIQIRSTLGAVMLALTSEPRLRCKVEEFLRANRLHPDICLRAAKVSLELLLYRTAEINDLLRTSKTW
ncbi:hypothetical protein C8F01DRAFT_33424 [Mycena amicta]|nr:hypothetical protein C8F01DRAFT_33424 [Mycena amicta]